VQDQHFKLPVFKTPLIDPSLWCVMARNAAAGGRRHLEWQRLINSVTRTTPAALGPTVDSHRSEILYSAIPTTASADGSATATTNTTSIYVCPPSVHSGMVEVESTAGDHEAGVKCGPRTER